MLGCDTAPGFTIDLAHKDLTLILEAANAVREPMCDWRERWEKSAEISPAEGGRPMNYSRWLIGPALVLRDTAHRILR